MLGFGAATLAMMLVSGYFLHKQQRDELYRLSVERATSLADALSRSSTSWVLAHDVAGLQEILSGLSNTVDLKRAFVLAPDGEVLASSRTDENNLYVNDPLSQSLLNAAPGRHVLLNQDNLIDVAMPIVAAGRHIGWARVEMTRDSENAALRDLVMLNLGFAICAMLLVALAAWLLSRRLMRGLDQLVVTTGEVELGHLDARAKVLRDDEIGMLARNFNHMLDTLNSSETRLRAIINASPVPKALNDAQQRITFLNPAFVTTFGYSQEDIPTLAEWWLKACPDPDYRQGVADSWQAHLDQALRDHKPFQPLELTVRCKDGSVKTVMGTATALENSPMHEHLVVLYDITEHKLNEAKIQRLSQLYAALSECNQIIVRCNDAEELFDEICRIAVQFGGFEMAWIGLLDHASGQVKPVASYGNYSDYLDDIDISTDIASPYGTGPTATAIREDQPCWCQDFQHDPATAPWHERGARAGWGASAALPLHRNGHPIGALTLYAGKPHAFDQASRELLREMAADISYALDNFVREAQLRLTAKVFEQSNDGFLLTDANCDIISANKALTDITGYSEAELLGKNPRMLSSGRHDREFFRAMWETINTHGHWQGEVWNRRKDGSLYPEWLSISQVKDSGGIVTEYIGILNDITQRKRDEEHIQQLAHFDTLTGLPNRALLQDRAEQAIRTAHRDRSRIAVLFIDLDHFKNVNDTLGHRVGDGLLIQVSERLKSSVRDNDTVARLGGDEFLLVLQDSDADGVAHIATKLLDILSRPYHIEQNELVVTPSIGIAMYPDDGEDFDTLHQHADVAMYRAKQDGRNNFRFYTAQMQMHSARMLQLENALRQAIERDQLHLVYQPQLAISGKRMIGVEALLRWQHPEFGMVSPAEFIPLAESSGQIIAIGEWALRSAVQQLKRWLDSGLPEMTVSVNLSAVQFRHPDLPGLVSRVLEASRLPSRFLELELTEGATIDKPQAAIAVIDDLYARGVRMAIDDFGTGYSSLSYLKKFKISKLKIDQSFVRDLSTDADDRAIVSAIIQLARSLGFQTIAEGVETQEQLEFLYEQGCDEVQGYYFSKPLPAEQIEAFLHAQR
ncbi:MAG: EAL domain-containing protein [Nitrosomonadales bacterium]|nr:EAL domain-containing protein [Nitrosomonadales bacterium]